MRLSIVTTLYRSAATIDGFYRRALAAALAITPDVEIVIVNDASPDDSLARALALQVGDPRVVVVDLARNFGHHKALMTGLAYAGGDRVFLVDSDLEEQPELLTLFHERFAQGDCDVVYGIQERRRGGWLERITGSVFYWLIGVLSDRPAPRNIIIARLMSRDFVRALVRHRDREFIISDLWQLTGFRQVPVTIQKGSSSPSTYSWRMRLSIAIKFLTTTSTKMLYGILYFGITVSLISLLAIVFYIARYLESGVGVDGFTSIIVSIWFFGGTTTFILGILGIYLGNIYSETKRRPYTIVREVHRRKIEPPDS